MVLRLLISGSNLQMIWVENLAVFRSIILHKGIIYDDIFRLYDIHNKQQYVYDKLCNLLVLMNIPKAKYRIRSILRYTSDVAKVLIIKCWVTLKVLSIYQYFIKEIYIIYPWITLQLETIQMVTDILQIILGVGENCFHGSNKYLVSGLCHWHHYQYFLKNITWQCDILIHSWSIQVLDLILILSTTIFKSLCMSFLHNPG